MLKLYIDCDGTILDTIPLINEAAKINGVDLKDKSKRREAIKFLASYDWDSLLKEADVINDGINKIIRINKSGLYLPSILTHVNGSREAKSKIEYFGKYLSDIKLYTVHTDIPKSDYISFVRGTILVDDYKINLYSWEEKGGLPVRFDIDKKPNSKFIVINDLDYFLTNYEEVRERALTLKKKARN